MSVQVTAAQPDDVPLILELVHELAEYEKEPDAARATPAQMHAVLFGPSPAAECAIAREDGLPAGFALWFPTFSTGTGDRGLWLEDIFIRPNFRRKGIGRVLIRHLARLALDRGYGRFEWSVLDWNRPALDFYADLGAEVMDEWTTHRLTGAALRSAASGLPLSQPYPT